MGLGNFRFEFEGMSHEKDRHDGRPVIYNNVEKQSAGTEAEDVGARFPLLIVHGVIVS